MKRRKIKIFYTLHNKESHYSTHKQIKRLIRKIVLSNSDFVLCHSKEGIDIINNEKGIKGKTLYLPHPFKKESLQDPVKEKKYDILIWGAIRPYKGIDKFFSYLESNNILKKYKTLVAGKIFPEEYEKELIVFRSDSLHIINSFIEDKVLNEFIAQSKITLFTYNENSVLSSGALIYSLSKGANVIGPNTGAFKDLYQEGLIEVFENYDELIEIIDKQLNSLSSKAKKINKYIEENSWEKFGSKISDWILGNNK
ncbi:MAG: hypothetical protein JXK95_00185 [Bacteroidales bacterium]|nr:hypothetical protein [Bacteroidales bacterium]